MWCKNCEKEVLDKICPSCNEKTQDDIPVEIFWCDNCNVPIIRNANDINKHKCTLCSGRTYYLSVDLRPKLLKKSSA